MKRKILSLLLAAAMLMSLMAGLSGCGSGNQAKTPGTQKSETFTVEDLKRKRIGRRVRLRRAQS